MKYFFMYDCLDYVRKIFMYLVEIDVFLKLDFEIYEEFFSGLEIGL